MLGEVDGRARILPCTDSLEVVVDEQDISVSPILGGIAERRVPLLVAEAEDVATPHPPS